MGLRVVIFAGLATMAACALPPLDGNAIDASSFGVDPGDGLSGGDGAGGSGGSGGGDSISPGDSLEPADQFYEPVTCNDGLGDRPAQPPGFGDLVINEVFGNPTGADLFADWFELYVAAPQPVDLNDITIRQTSPGQSPRALAINAASCLVVNPGQYVVIGASTDPAQTRGAPVTFAPGVLQLFNEASTLELWLGPILLDDVSLPAPNTGASWELDPSKQSADQNDLASAFCVATRSDVFDELGSPGEANADCP